MARKTRNKSSSFADRFDSLRAAIRAGSTRLCALAAVTFLLVCVGLVWWGVPKLRTRLDQKLLDGGGLTTVSFVDAPAWFDGLRQSEVSQQVARAVGTGSTLDPHRLAKAQAALTSTGWFHTIEQVRLADNGGFIVDATFVKPFAVVRHEQYDYLVDTSGRLLPLQWPAGHRPASPHYIALVGAKEFPRGEFGTPWPGGDIAAGLELARALHQEPWIGQVAAINVSQFASNNALTLITANGGEVIWGRAPSERTAAEVPCDTKLRTLGYLYAQHGRIDNGGGRTLDLRGDLVTMQPAAVAPASTAMAQDEP